MDNTKPVSKTVSVTVNGKPVQVDSKCSVFQAATDAGVNVPHYCYHPDLSIAGVCRMCVVEVEKNPRLQISCNTPVAEGMVIRTDTPKVKEAVKACLELHLINHPLDCPICDKAGECKLQDFYRDFGLYQSRMEFDQKVHKPKVVDIGTIVLDSERCILCTRCVRFTAEVTGTNELGIFNRGDRSELRTYDHGPLHNEYTGNLADICPVGALTAKDFRFACRVWFLDKTKSVCTLCAHGCNTEISVNPTTRTLYRVEPRRNPEVNKSWICDVGRWEYGHVSDDKRVRIPRKRFDGAILEATWENAFNSLNETVKANPKKVLVGLSTQLTNEEVVDAVETLTGLGVDHFTWLVDEKVVAERKPYDKLLKHRDQTPNALGFERVMETLKQKWSKWDKVKSELKAGNFDLVLCLGLEGHNLSYMAEFLAMVPKGTQVAAHVTSMAPWLETADWVLPNVSAYEKSGTLISAEGRLQKLNGAIPWQHTSRDVHALVFGLKNGHDRAQAPVKRAQEIFESFVVEKVCLGAEAKWRRFHPMGLPLKGASAHV